jgi:hypothetical protein
MLRTAVDADGERGAVVVLVALDHRGQLQLCGALLGHRDADQAATVGDHVVDGRGVGVLRRHDEVSFVLPVLVVHHNDELTACDGRHGRRGIVENNRGVEGDGSAFEDLRGHLASFA